MASSGSKDFNLTRNEIIDAAFREIRLLREEQSAANATQIKFAARALDVMLKNWRGEGIFLSELNWATLALHASTVVLGSDGLTYECIRNNTAAANTKPVTGAKYASYWQVSTKTVTDTWVVGLEAVSIAHYFLDAFVVGIDRGFLREGTTDTRLQKLTQQEYFELGNKVTSGRPTMYYFRRQAIPELFLFPFPDSSTNYVLNLAQDEYPDDMDTAANNLSLPIEWLEPVIKGLAIRLNQRYNTLKNTELNQLRTDFLVAKRNARALDEETGNMFIQPDLMSR